MSATGFEGSRPLLVGDARGGKDEEREPGSRMEEARVKHPAFNRRIYIRICPNHVFPSSSH